MPVETPVPSGALESAGSGGAGGGLAVLTVDGTLTIDGFVSANGWDGGVGGGNGAGAIRAGVGTRGHEDPRVLFLPHEILTSP